MISTNSQKMLNDMSEVTRRVKLGTQIKNLQQKADVTNAGIIAAIEDYLKNHVQAGLLAGAPSTGSTHADGSTYDFNVNISAGIVIVDGVMEEFTLQEDFDIDNGSTSPIGETNDTIIYAIVAKNDSGTITLAVVAGSAAPSASAAAPSDSDINTSVGHSDWIRLANVTFTRTGASTVSTAYENGVRPVYS